jgi:hypothetical protein
MNIAGKGTGTVGYNVQTAVDTKNHMIIAHEVTNVGHDRTHLTEMSERARAAIGTKSRRHWPTGATSVGRRSANANRPG